MKDYIVEWVVLFIGGVVFLIIQGITVEGVNFVLMQCMFVIKKL